MATILIAPFPERGHVNPTLRLAKQLRERGHRVVYCSIADIEDPVLAEGFEFVRIFERLCPKGTYARAVKEASGLRGLQLLLFARKFMAMQTGMLRAMMEGELDGLLKALRPELLLCDVLMPHPPLVAYGHGVPVLLFNTTIPLRREPGEPPLGSGEIPDGRWVTRARIAGAWWRLSARNWRDAVKVWLGLSSPNRRYLRLLARRHGFPSEALDFEGQSPGLRLPELVLCPRQFVEFGRARTGGQYLYTEASIDLERQEPDFPWERLPEDKPLHLFSLGTMQYRAETQALFHGAVLEIARRRPDWSLVLSLGRTGRTPGLESAPPNLIAVEQVPQLQLLRRATSMVTHGGFNSVKESIHFGVPMVVVPHLHDQPGIAARVVYHGLGERLDPSRLSPERLLSLVEKVSHEPSYRRAAERMRAHFHDAESNARCVDVIQRFLDSGPGGVAWQVR
ncbi:glycosyltransferase [Myxococcus stipitatus]|uniref:glycosyltransferase n=1 Tax=Myxococcus stipitatus TaxID=83455 RepID=UPI001F3031AB|nr:glycosyltransferase [Myxococcus stipitatus]MCE9671224.1 glycosyltransferase [Myxococcus stipitatus]